MNRWGDKYPRKKHWIRRLCDLCGARCGPPSASANQIYAMYDVRAHLYTRMTLAKLFGDMSRVSMPLGTQNQRFSSTIKINHSNGINSSTCVSE